MGEFIITYTDIQFKAIEACVLNVQQWLQTSWNKKSDSCINKLFEVVDDRRASKVSKEEITTIIEGLKIEEPSNERQKKDLADRIIK